MVTLVWIRQLKLRVKLNVVQTTKTTGSITYNGKTYAVKYNGVWSTVND